MKTNIKKTGFILILLMIGLNSNYSQAQTSMSAKEAINGKIWISKEAPNGSYYFSTNNGVLSYYVNNTKIGEVKFQFAEVPDAIYNPNLIYLNSNGNYMISENNKNIYKIEFINDHEFRQILLRAPGEPISLPGHLWTYYVVK